MIKEKQKLKAPEPWWSNLGGFFGAKYIEGDNSLEGYLPEKQESLEERTRREVDGVIRLLELKKKIGFWTCLVDTEGTPLNS